MEEAASFEAATAVLETTEMLEHIMRFLDMKALLLSQRVGKRWQATIKGSIMLQKKLFMLPATLDDVFELDMIEARQDNEILVIFDHMRNSVTNRESSLYSIVNRLLFDRVRDGSWQFFEHSFEWTAVEGSWCNMQIGQPLLSGFGFTFTSPSENGRIYLSEDRFATTMEALRGKTENMCEYRMWEFEDGKIRLNLEGRQTKEHFMELLEQEGKV